MNRQIEDNLESYLSGTLDQAGVSEFRQAVDGLSAEDQAVLRRMEKQSQLMRAALRPPEPAELGAGFYARVLERIEAQRTASPFWSAFLEPLLFRRLVMASATLLVLLGLTLFTAGPDDTMIAGDQPVDAIMAGSDPEPLVTTSVSDGSARQQGRDAVLGDLTTYQE